MIILDYGWIMEGEGGVIEGNAGGVTLFLYSNSDKSYILLYKYSYNLLNLYNKYIKLSMF